MRPSISSDELIERLLAGDRTISRNKNFELFAGTEGRRARRRAGFLRSIAREIAGEVEPGAKIRVDAVARGNARVPDATERCVVVSIERAGVRRRAYLSRAELALIARMFPRAAESLAAMNVPTRGPSA